MEKEKEGHQLLLPFLIHLPDDAARKAFRELPPLKEGSEGNGAGILGGEAAADLTGGAVLACLAPVAWFTRLYGLTDKSDKALSTFRDADKTVRLCAAIEAPEWLGKDMELLPRYLSWEFPEPEDKLPPGSVFMGLIDDGIAVAHERLCDANGKTRVQSYWDQNKFLTAAETGHGPMCDTSKSLRGEITKADIDAVLGAAGPYGDEDWIYQKLGLINFRDPNPEFVASSGSHGAHVADLAAGYPPSAPEASKRPVIAVQLPNPVIAQPVDDTRLDFYIWLAIQFVALRAAALAKDAEKPLLVICLSFGKIAGPHDGTGLLETAIDKLIEKGDDRTHVAIAAGNQHLSQCRARVELKAEKEAETFDWIVHPDDRTHSTVEAWLPDPPTKCKTERVTIEVVQPDEQVSTFVEFPGKDVAQHDPVDIEFLGKTAGQISLHQNRNGRRMIRIDIGPTVPDPLQDGIFDMAPSGRWQLKFTAGPTPPSGPIHIWSQRDDTLHGYPQAGRQSYFDHPNYTEFAEKYLTSVTIGPDLLIEDDDHPDQKKKPSPVKRSSLLNAIATGEHSLVAGSAFERTGRVAGFSAGGPTTPGSPEARGRGEPEVLFPTDGSLVHDGIYAAGPRSGTSVAMRGTSAAAPQLTRWIAETLSKHPSGKSAEKLRELLDNEATEKAPEAPTTNRCGRGTMPRQGPEPRIKVDRFEP
ncbi:MAG: S8 family serine peptidase [Pseudomonadota bacterium]